MEKFYFHTVFEKMGTEIRMLCQDLALVSVSLGLNADVPNVPDPSFHPKIALPNLRTSSLSLLAS